MENHTSDSSEPTETWPFCVMGAQECRAGSRDGEILSSPGEQVDRTGRGKWLKKQTSEFGVKYYLMSGRSQQKQMIHTLGESNPRFPHQMYVRGHNKETVT